MHTLIILKKNTQKWYLPLPPGRVTPTLTNVSAQPESQGDFRKRCTGAKDTGRGGFRHHLPRQSGRASFLGEGLTCAGLTPVEQSSHTHATQEAAVRSKALPRSTAHCRSRVHIRFHQRTVAPHEARDGDPETQCGIAGSAYPRTCKTRKPSPSWTAPKGFPTNGSKNPSCTKSTDFETQRQCTASREKWRKWPACASEKESDYST